MLLLLQVGGLVQDGEDMVKFYLVNGNPKTIILIE